MASITPFLWLNDTVDEAVSFYTSVFKDARVENVVRIPGPDGGERAYFANFELQGQKFMALNGGPLYSFTPAISLYVNCEGQDEVDYYWDRLTADGGEPGQCGWLTDKFGLSWQVIPTRLGELMGDPARAQRVTEAMLKMKKIDIAGLEAA
jgi:predicted 3-demethylubiquinone-9 3-methyltransferase (glyoxalase superfamily)